MEINESVLNDLSDSQIEFSGQFLEAVFLQNKTAQSHLSDSELDVVFRLIQAVQTPEMKRAILTGVGSSAQLKLAAKMNTDQLVDLFGYLDDIVVLRKIFKPLDRDVQNEILKAVYKTDRENYAELQTLVSDRVRRVGDVLVSKSPMLDKMLEREISALLDMIQSPKFAVEDAAISAKKMEKKYDISDQEKLCLALLSAFAKLKNPMKNPADFAVHLKFYFFLDPFLKTVSELDAKISPQIDAVISALQSMPNGEWIVRVLNQFPVSVIGAVLTRIAKGERSTSLPERSRHMQLMKEIKRLIESPEAENIRQAFSHI
jgi:hypothetical protein